MRGKRDIGRIASCITRVNVLNFEPDKLATAQELLLKLKVLGTR